MSKNWIKGIYALSMLAVPMMAQAKQWSLQDCINYALQNNITIQKNHLQRLSANEDVLESKAQLLPSLSASTNQDLAYTPWVESGIVSSDGYSRASIAKVSYNGSYGINGSWTIWNGNRNKNAIKLNQLIAEKASIDSITTAQSIQEQIAQFYIQILYSTEAINVNRENLKISQENEARGKEMYVIGKMSKADVAQLEAQTAQDQYNVVSAESNTRNYKRQLKQLLQIANDDPFDIVIPTMSDAQALGTIPALNGIYAAALDNRPEIKSYQNAINQGDLNIQIAKAQNLPTISANAGVSTSTTTMNTLNWSRQLKTNMNVGAGITVSIPIFDNRAKKTAYNKAIIARNESILDLKNEQTTLYSTIENYWLQATTNQNQYKAAQISTSSAKTSYELLSEQFKVGLKNVSELRTGKSNLLTSEQNELQSKYLTIYNLEMLNFYQNGTLIK
jgi:outer membrane protein